MTFWDTVEGGEYIMIALAVVIVVVVCILWVRSWQLHKQKKSYSDLMHRVRDYIVEGDFENAFKLCRAKETPGAFVLETGIRNMGQPIPDILRSMDTVSESEKKKLAKGARWLRFISIAAPLSGLCGTLAGITHRLYLLGAQESGVDISVMAAEIAPTIVTTIAGLITGILALLALVFLEKSIESSQTELNELEAGFINLINEPS